MPLSSAGVAFHGAAQRDRRFSYQLAVSFRRSCITQWLILEITAITDQMAQQTNLRVRPDHRACDLRELPPNRNSRSRGELAHRLPAISRKYPVARRRTQPAAAGKRHAIYLAHTFRPDSIALRLDDLLILAHCPDFRCLSDQLANGNAPAVRETHQGFPGHALAKIRHHGFLFHALFDA